MATTQATSGGIGFTGILQLIFITLKLCKVITWSWWLVFAPILLPFALVAFYLLVVAIVIFIIFLIQLAIGKERKAVAGK